MGKVSFSVLRCEFTVRVWMVLISAAIICSDNRFWMFFSTWHGGSYTKIGITLLALSCLPIAFILYKDGSAMRARYLVPCSIVFLMLVVYYRFGLTGIAIPTRLLVLIALLYLVFCLSEERKALLLETFTIIFAVAMFLGMVYYLLRWIGVDLTTLTLESPNVLKTTYGQYYSISPFGVLLNKRAGFDYCGYFDESGCLGTFAVLLFVATNGLAEAFPKRGALWLARIILIVEGAVSLSFAFYLIIGMYLCAQCVTTRKWSLLAGLIVAVGIVFFVMSIEVENETLIRLQQRFGAIFDSTGSIDNRLSTGANAKMDEFFLNPSLIIHLFGFGPGEFASWQASHAVDGASVYYYLYDRGYIGMILYFGSIISVFIYAGGYSAKNWVLLTVFLLSTYQRPEVFSSIYMIILMLGSRKYRGLSCGQSSKLLIDGHL